MKRTSEGGELVQINGVVEVKRGQQGRLFIGFAAAELLGLMAFVVAMIILYAR